MMTDKGIYYGTIVGDALGGPVEFKLRGSYTVQDMTLWNNNFHVKLPPGSWTDDTSLTLCLAVSLTNNGFDPKDQLNRYLNWYENGYLSVVDECFDIGTTTLHSLQD